MRALIRFLPLQLSLLVVACGGAPPPESPADVASAAPATTPAAAPSSTPAAASGAPASSAAKDDEGWAGEKEAKAADKPASDKPASDKPASDKAATDKPGTGPTPKPAAGADKVPETRTLEVITKIIQDNRKAVRECYDKARKDLPTLQGDMTIHFVLDPEGAVKVADLNQEKSSLKSPAVVDCAIKVIKGLKFPKSSRAMETTTNYPFHFTPGG